MAGTKVDRTYQEVAVAKSQIGWDADVTVLQFSSS
jgi:hypothetical protein